MAANDDFVRELSKRYGASVEQSDIDTLNAKNPEDVEAHKRALETQYQQRGSNTPNQGSGGGQQQYANTSPAQSWNQAPIDPYPAWYQSLMQQQLQQQQAQAAETKQ